MIKPKTMKEHFENVAWCRAREKDQFSSWVYRVNEPPESVVRKVPKNIYPLLYDLNRIHALMLIRCVCGFDLYRALIAYAVITSGRQRGTRQMSAEKIRLLAALYGKTPREALEDINESLEYETEWRLNSTPGA
jgi:hypothetical protein